ncbi:TetR/AcrR family transcriptional regulator [Nonomuraea sp. bgisy094]|uniref:TetR/AcrR family transcriptional regulator n=1 Tax=Nonomuraea sp. bgisy094 TaxID=3413781 RepID=UPI003EB9946E
MVDAAVRLSAAGATPSIDEIAAAADVSRRTIYMYFPALDQLLVDATAGALNEPPVEAALSDLALADDAAGRVDALIRTLLEYSPQSLPLGRRMIRLTVDPPTNGAPEPVGPRRSQRRIEWLDQACAPARHAERRLLPAPDLGLDHGGRLGGPGGPPGCPRARPEG